MFTAEDLSFVRAILASPAELTSWLVYADWLDEHDNPLHAEFLRLEIRRGQLRNTEPEWYAVEDRLKERRAGLNPNWVAVFDRPKIENCGEPFRFKCPKRWENLRVTNDPAVRHCGACNKNVYFCRTLPEAQSHARQERCVAVQLDVLRYPDDLKRRGAEELYLPEIDDSSIVDMLEGFDEPEPPRPPWWKFW